MSRQVLRSAATAAALVAGLVGPAFLAPPPAAAAAVTFSAAGANAAAISPTVSAFQAAIGGSNNFDGPPAATGRREINWDNVPDAQAAPNSLPADLFNTTSPRGALLATGGTGFEV